MEKKKTYPTPAPPKSELKVGSIPISLAKSSSWLKSCMLRAREGERAATGIRKVRRTSGELTRLHTANCVQKGGERADFGKGKRDGLYAWVAPNLHAECLGEALTGVSCA
jgi:hypothetical protein